MKNIFTFSLFLLGLNHAFGQNNDTIFYDNDWEKCIKENASYYRTIQKDSLFIIKDFYMDGQLQMEGTYKDMDPEIKHGVFTYYNQNGKISKREYYKVGNTSGYTEYYDLEGKFLKDLINVDELDTKPEFKGGIAEFNNYIIENLRYPEDAAKAGVSGKVYLSFWVQKDGSIGNIKILRSVHPSIDEEAIRIVKNSPKWKPGMVKKNPVIVEYVLPINFKFTND